MTASVARETKRRRVCPPTRKPFEGTTLLELLTHLETDAPCVKVEALDALGAPVSRDSDTNLEDAADSIRVIADAAFVAKIEGLGGAAPLETLLVVGDDETQKTNGAGAGIFAAASSVVITVAPLTGEDERGRSEGRTPAHHRVSRAHVLLTRRAREVFTNAAGDEEKRRKKDSAEQTKKHLLDALYALVSWLDDRHDVFVSPDPCNPEGRIMAPDPEAGGALVPSRLLRRET